MKRLAAVAFFLLALSGCATDGQMGAVGAPPAQYPEAVSMIVRQGGEAKFLGRAHGMDGWIVMLDGSVRAMYVTPDGKGVVVGLLHDESGENLTMVQVKALATQMQKPLPEVAAQDVVSAPEPAPAQSMEAQAWEAAGKLRFVPIGDPDAPMVYVLFDPRCGYCKGYLRTLIEGPLSERTLNVRLLPISVLGDSSTNLSAAMLATASPAESFMRHAVGQNGELPEATAGDIAAVQHNTEVMEKFGMTSTPRTLYKTPDGKVGMMRGTPNNIRAFVKLVSGQP